MTKSDLVAGVKQWWWIDGTGDLLILAFYAVLAGTVLIAGGPLWFSLMMLLPPVVSSAVTIVRLARSNHEAREFYEWVMAQPYDPADQQPETD